MFQILIWAISAGRSKQSFMYYVLFIFLISVINLFILELLHYLREKHEKIFHIKLCSTNYNIT